ncbi:hypothetical protein CONCODRAFT_125851, partial [Conidiobolus coronatus NRRL 28638]
ENKKLHKILSIKESVQYFSHSDFLQLSYTCKYINELLREKIRSNLVFIANDKITLNNDSFMDFIKKWKNYINLNQKAITSLHGDFKHKNYSNTLKFHLLFNLNVLNLENIREINVVHFNKIIYKLKKLKILSLKHVKMYMKETENDDLIHFQLPSTLAELTIIDLDTRLSFSDEVHDSIYQSSDFETICKGILIAHGSSLSNLKHLRFGKPNARVILFDCILELASNLQTLTVFDSSSIDYNLARIKKLTKIKAMKVNSSDAQFNIANFRKYIPKKITELSIGYDYETNLWPSSPIISYGFKDLQKLSIQYNPNSNFMETLVKGLIRLKHLIIVGKPYNKDIDKLNFQNNSIQELNLIHFQYSTLNFKVFNQWKGLKKITIDLKTSMNNYYIYFELCEMLNNWKYCTFPNSVQFWNLNKN